MAFDSYVHNVLIVSGSEKGRYYFKNILIDCHYTFNTRILSDSQEARRLLLNNEYDIVIINSPLADESGINLAIHTSERTNSIIIYVVKQENYDDCVEKLSDTNIMVISKPINKGLLYQSLNNAIILQNKRREYEKEIRKLKDRLEETRIVGQAKCMLIEHKHMTEEEAHKYIEKTAMDLRDKKINVALEIIRNYSY